MIKMKLRKYLLPLILVIGLMMIFFVKGYEVKPQIEDNGRTTFTMEEKVETIKVYITGEVLNPGVYEMDPEDRLDVLIGRCGGFTEDADVQINLARKLKDGEMIVVYKIASQEIAYVGIDLFNYASEEELMQVEGIGETLASRIVSYRTNKGMFSEFNDLLEVEGIGEKKLQLIMENLNIE
ncbi:MAG: helix-hairpin-helix domain-containing protein [Clostridia bacterium]|nr:helix-hairpin-helix domain-containing protein [Clostridia bacterium]